MWPKTPTEPQVNPTPLSTHTHLKSYASEITEALTRRMGRIALSSDVEPGLGIKSTHESIEDREW